MRVWNSQQGLGSTLTSSPLVCPPCRRRALKERGLQGGAGEGGVRPGRRVCLLELRAPGPCSSVSVDSFSFEKVIILKAKNKLEILPASCWKVQMMHGFPKNNYN